MWACYVEYSMGQFAKGYLPAKLLVYLLYLHVICSLALLHKIG